MNKQTYRLNKDFFGYIFIAPFIIVFLLFSLYPIVNTFYLSFTNTQLMTGFKGEFTGLQNYIRLFETPMFLQSVKNTWIIWLINFIPQITFALLLATIFNNQRLKLRGVGVFKAIYFLPNLLMPAAVASLFNSFLSLYGPVNQLLISTGMTSEAISFLKVPFFTVSTVAFIQWWMWFGQTTIVIFAGMTSISLTYYEAAMVDGASQFAMFKSITLPLLKPILIYTLVTSLVGGLQMFDIPYLLTNGTGQPQGSIMTMNILMNMKRTSAAGDIGAAASVSIMIFLMSALVSLIIMKLLSEKE